MASESSVSVRLSALQIQPGRLRYVACFGYGNRVKLLLIDGHYYVYRSFFAIQNLANSRGEPTNAIFGFTKTVRRMLKDLRPELGAVVWDEGLPQKRVELQPAYKETRKEMPTPMVPQLDFVQKLTPLLGFKNISLPNTEADDLLGCYALAARNSGVDAGTRWSEGLTGQHRQGEKSAHARKAGQCARADFAEPEDGRTRLRHEAAVGNRETQDQARLSETDRGARGVRI